MNETNLVQNLENLNALPKSWAIEEFKDVISENSAGNIKVAKSKFLNNGPIAIVDQGKELIGGYFNDSDSAVKTPPPYIVFGDHTRVFKYVDFPFVMGADGIKVLQSQRANTSLKFIFYFLKSLVIPNTGYNRHFKYVKSIKIPIPPLSEQKKIAAILDAADAFRQKTKALIAKYDELAQSIFLDMFGDPVTNPMGWEVQPLSELCIKITDGTHHSPEPQNSGYPYVTAKHIKPYFLNFLAKPTFVNEAAHNEIYKRCTPESGDVLYIKDGATTGVACINTFKRPISLLSSVALLKLRPTINNDYLCHWLNHDGVKNKLINEFMSGAAIKRYTLKKINLFKVPVPNEKLQKGFSNKYQELQLQKAKAQKCQEQTEILFNCLLQKAFKGELT